MKDAAAPTFVAWPAALMALFCLTGLGSLATCSPAQSQRAQIEARGALRVATLNSPTTYFEGADGPTGFEYDLARGFAESLGVTLDVRVAQSPGEALEWVATGHADIAGQRDGQPPARRRAVDGGNDRLAHCDGDGDDRQLHRAAWTGRCNHRCR